MLDENANCSPDQATYTSLRYGNDQDDTAVWLNGHGCHRGYTIVVGGGGGGVVVRLLLCSDFTTDHAPSRY
jgi:hypothetical protein